MGALRNSVIPETWVVFSGRTDLPWLRLLKPGFRHCFVLMNDGACWFSLDPMSHCTEVSVHHHVPMSFDLPRWLAGRGYKIIRVKAAREPKPAPWMVFTCVEAVKRVIGLRSRMIFTPWQLYRHLSNLSNIHLQEKGEFAWEV